MLTWVFSDRGTPASYRMMEGFGVNTYVWVNNDGKPIYVKYHWKPKFGVHNFDRQNATRISGKTQTISLGTSVTPLKGEITQR